MAQASQRVRRLRRVKRERSQLRQAIKVQQNQLQTVVKLLMDAQAEVRELKPKPSFTITTLADDVDPDVSDVVAAPSDENIYFMSPDGPVVLHGANAGPHPLDVAIANVAGIVDRFADDITAIERRAHDLADDSPAS